MSNSTNRSVNFCDVCNLSFETKKSLYGHQSNDSKHKDLLEKMFGSDLRTSFADDKVPINAKPNTERVIPENTERVYNSDEDDYILTPKDNTKDIIKTKTKTKSETEAEIKPKTEGNIYIRIKYECKECHEEVRIK